jgi:hypothetical protein
MREAVPVEQRARRRRMPARGVLVRVPPPAARLTPAVAVIT